MSRHASPTPVQFAIPAHYLTEATKDYPLILLADTAYYGDAVVTANDLPVGVGLTPRTEWDEAPCPDCAGACYVWVQDCDDEGPGEVECLLCLLTTYGTSYGVVPAMAVQWVGADE